MEETRNDTEQTSFTVDVAHAFETLAEMTIRLEKRVIALEEIVVMQQRAMRMLSDAVGGHQKIIEAQNDSQPAPSRPLSVN